LIAPPAKRSKAQKNRERKKTRALRKSSNYYGAEFADDARRVVQRRILLDDTEVFHRAPDGGAPT
jgi:hypothetical protein